VDDDELIAELHAARLSAKGPSQSISLAINDLSFLFFFLFFSSCVPGMDDNEKKDRTAFDSAMPKVQEYLSGK
jgi:hypothetical protein